MFEICSEYSDEKLLFSFNESDDVDAVIINTTNIEKKDIIYSLEKLLNSNLIIMGFKDLYFCFHNSGKWKFEYYEIYNNDIEKFKIHNQYFNQLFVSFTIGSNVKFSELEDILDKFQTSNPLLEITFGCVLDDNLESNKIKINIFNQLLKKEVVTNMINNMNDFIKEHPYSVIVNYDIASKFECGKIFRTNKMTVENFRKDSRGKYIEYPFIQPYLSLSDSSQYELFIIYNKKVFQLELGENENTYKICKEITNINFDIGYDDVFYRTGIKPTIVNENIWIIEN